MFTFSAECAGEKKQGWILGTSYSPLSSKKIRFKKYLLESCSYRTFQGFKRTSPPNPFPAVQENKVNGSDRSLQIRRFSSLHYILIIFDLLGIRIFILWSRTFSSFEGVEIEIESKKGYQKWDKRWYKDIGFNSGCRENYF